MEETESAPPQRSIVFTRFEQALKVVGAFGRYQWTFAVVLQLSVVIYCGNFVFMPYATYLPDVACTLDNGSELYLTQKAPHDEAFCAAYGSGDCANVTYSAPFKTIIEEWNLICDKDHIPELVNSLQTVGTFVALALCGRVSDLFGRKSAFVGSFAFLLVTTFLSALATSWLWFIIARIVVGGFISASLMIHFVWGMELTDQKHNLIINFFSQWQLAYMVTAVLGYLTGDWRIYLMVLNAIGLPLLLVLACFVESPRWLVQKGQAEKAARLLTQIGLSNRESLQRTEVSSDNLQRLSREATAAGGDRWTALFLNRQLAVYTGVLALLVFATAAAATSFIFQVSVLSGSPFVKFFSYGAMRMTIPFAIYALDRRFVGFGRRLMTLVPLFLVICCFVVAIVAQSVEPQSEFVFYGLLLGAVICNALWAAIGQYSIELYPTGLRNTAAAVVSLLDPVASVITPQLVYLERVWPVLPLVFVLCATVTAFCLSYALLPETKGRALPDTLADAVALAQPAVDAPPGWHKLASGCCGEEEALLADVGGLDDLDLDEDLAADSDSSLQL